MADTDEMLTSLDARALRRADQRSFFTSFATASAIAGGFVLAAKP